MYAWIICSALAGCTQPTMWSLPECQMLPAAAISAAWFAILLDPVTDSAGRPLAARCALIAAPRPEIP
jgi:hypothetical protein